MNCREFRDELHRGASAPGPEARRHASSCPACEAEARAALLLRLGSQRGEAAAPPAGFEKRLRARLDSGAVPVEASPWTRELDPLVRPALALAGALVIACFGFCGFSLYARSAAAPRQADLASLFEADPVFSFILAGDPGGPFAGPEDATPTPESP